MRGHWRAGRQRACAAVVAGGLWLGWPVGAWAHSPMPGMGSFYNGVLHPAVVPAHLLCLLALGLFIGQQPRQQDGLAVPLMLAGTALGVLLAAWLPGPAWLEQGALAWALLLGGLVAARPALSRLVRQGVVALAATWVGLDSGPDALQGAPRALALAGTALGMVMLTTWTLMLADWVATRASAWPSVALRVLGSWIAAASLLVLTLALAQGSG